MSKKKITPRDGILVPLPDGNGNLPPEGKVLTLSSYWYQRKDDGDVTFSDVPSDDAAAVAAPLDVTIADMAAATDVRPVAALGAGKATKSKKRD